ncbi:HEL086Wp [Eremothecium sinecaudum]|uniref:Elongator complex protein 5 n=1 Tax=Eremothecium sinecaudum TaxID=45286 RepID=A0A0X8HTH8_9SACH|nr:HEL086Wp [Eremothecium sinecaudum]AMD21194.1 HEL086Wp [Eremothecium sinecaudum]
MTSNIHNPAVLLKRVFSLKEQSSFILCTDTMAQSSEHLISEFIFNMQGSDIPILYVSFEHLNKPEYANYFVEAANLSVEQIVAAVEELLPKQKDGVSKKSLVIIDAINYIPTKSLSKFVGSLASPNVTVITTYHKSLPAKKDPSLQHYPSSLQLLQFISTKILEVNPLTDSIDQEELDYDLNRFVIPRNMNAPVYSLTFTNRRRSGRSLTYQLKIDSKTHNYSLIMGTEDDSRQEDDTDALNSLTTFNLSTTKKQKLAKEQLDLPYLQAQSFNTGGAIVYEFEKDDDYDEEDPYEDPF